MYCVTFAIRRSTKRTCADAGAEFGPVINSGWTSSTTRDRRSVRTSDLATRVRQDGETAKVLRGVIGLR
jgi:hypothetical protein